jgi:DNA-binding CsgD family transcriptional regulator
MTSTRDALSSPLVERDRERSELLDLFGSTDAHGSTPSAAVIVGAAGVGKSRLMNECVSQIEHLGFHPLVVMATPALREVPFGAFRQMLPAFDDEIGSWLRVLRDGTARLRELAGDRRPLLVVDDLQELDPGSVALVLHALDAATVSMIATVRSEGRFRPHVVDMLKRFWGDRLAARVDLAPLTRVGVAALASNVLGAPVDALSVERLWTWTGGNPFLLRLVLADGFAAETFDERAGLWQIDRGAAGPGLLSVVEQSLHGVPDEVLRVARLLAEADSLSLDVLVRAAGPDAVDRAEERGLVVATDGAAGIDYRLTHPLYGDVLRAQETLDERCALRDVLATALIADAGTVEAVPNADRVLLALWYVDQQDLSEDAQFVLLDAARQSMRSWNHRAAVRFADAVWQAGASIDAGIILCKAYDGLGMDTEACDVASYLLDHARNDAERLIATIQLAGAETRRSGNLERSREILEQSMARLDDPQWAAGLQIHLANLLMHEGRLDEALEVVGPIAEADPDGFGLETVAVVAPIGVAQGRTDEALARARAVRAAMDGGRHLMAAQPWLIDVIVGLAELEGGDLEAARTTLTVVYDDGVARGDVEIVGWAALQLGRVLLLEGVDLAEASRLFREAAAALGQLIGPRYVAWALGGLTGSLAQAGDLDDARVAAVDFDVPPPHSVRFFQAEAQRQRAWLDVLEGDRATAIDRLDGAARMAHGHGEWAVEAACLHDLARVSSELAGGRGGHDPDPVERTPAGLDLDARMQTVVDRGGLQSALVAARAQHLAGLTGKGDVDAYEAAATAFDAMGARLLAAEAWAGVAALRRRLADERGAARARLRAHALVVGRTGPPTPLLQGLEEVRLTERQETVARLASAGVSRQTMAERCFVSQRTIDRHLDDVFGVLGIRTKDDLGAALADYDTARQISRSTDADELLAELAASTITRRPPGVPPLTHHELEFSEDGRVTIGRPHEAGERRRDR